MVILTQFSIPITFGPIDNGTFFLKKNIFLGVYNDKV